MGLHLGEPWNIASGGLFKGIYEDPKYKSFKGSNCSSSPECWFQCVCVWGGGIFGQKMGTILGENESNLGQVLRWFWELFTLEKVWV